MSLISEIASFVYPINKQANKIKVKFIDYRKSFSNYILFVAIFVIAVFFFVYFTLGNNLAKKDDKNIVWGSFIWFTLISFVTEILLIYIYHPK